MGRHQFIVKMRSLYPDITFLKRIFTRMRIAKIQKYLLPKKLIAACEMNEKLKTETVEKYLTKWEKRLKRSTKKAKELITNHTAGLMPESFTDIMFCRIAYGFSPEEYITFSLADKDMNERQSFISDQERYCCVYRMNDIRELQIFNDKVETYKLLQPYFKRKAIKVETKQDLQSFLEFVKYNPIFVKKNACESVGRSVELVDISSCGSTPEEYFNSLISIGKHIIEEQVKQHPLIASFNPSSVNTVRCIAIKTKHGVVTPYCLMRFGRNGAFIDNAGAGGIIAGIDVLTGIINTDGIDRAYCSYDTHPDTGMRFKGTQLPEWQNMLGMVEKMMNDLKHVKYVGWDMAYSIKGWCVIEGNGMSQLVGPQFLTNHGIKAEITDIMKDVDLIV